MSINPCDADNLGDCSDCKVPPSKQRRCCALCRDGEQCRRAAGYPVRSLSDSGNLVFCKQHYDGEIWELDPSGNGCKSDAVQEYRNVCWNKLTSRRWVSKFIPSIDTTLSTVRNNALIVDKLNEMKLDSNTIYALAQDARACFRLKQEYQARCVAGQECGFKNHEIFTIQTKIFYRGLMKWLHTSRHSDEQTVEEYQTWEENDTRKRLTRRQLKDLHKYHVAQRKQRRSELAARQGDERIWNMFTETQQAYLKDVIPRFHEFSDAEFTHNLNRLHISLEKFNMLLTHFNIIPHGQPLESLVVLMRTCYTLKQVQTQMIAQLTQMVDKAKRLGKHPMIVTLLWQVVNECHSTGIQSLRIYQALRTLDIPYEAVLRQRNGCEELAEENNRYAQSEDAKGDFIHLPGPEMNQICITCGKSATRFCSRCRLIAYCSTECQRIDYPRHKPNC